MLSDNLPILSSSINFANFFYCYFSKFLIFFSFLNFIKNEKQSLLENMRSELEERLRKVEEDRHTVEMYSGRERCS